MLSECNEKYPSYSFCLFWILPPSSIPAHTFWQLFTKGLLCIKHWEYLNVSEWRSSGLFLMEPDEKTDAWKGNCGNYRNVEKGVQNPSWSREGGEGRWPNTKYFLNWHLRINTSAKGKERPSSPVKSLCKELSPFPWDWWAKSSPDLCCFISEDTRFENREFWAQQCQCPPNHPQI